MIFIEFAEVIGIIGVIVELRPKGIENNSDMDERKTFPRRIGYKF